MKYGYNGRGRWLFCFGYSHIFKSEEPTGGMIMLKIAVIIGYGLFLITVHALCVASHDADEHMKKLTKCDM